jgi:hypothetical protein
MQARVRIKHVVDADNGRVARAGVGSQAVHELGRAQLRQI